MRNKGLIRFQLLLLVALAGLLIWRSNSVSTDFAGVVVLDDLKSGELYRTAVRVDRETSAVVSVSASFETDDADAPLATYGWIIDAHRGEIVWETQPMNLERDGVVGVGTDTIYFSPGAYEVYYTTFGPSKHSIDDAPFLGLTPYWTSYASSWGMSVEEADGAAGVRSMIVSEGSAENKQEYDRLLWSTGPVSERGLYPFLFRVSKPLDLKLEAVGQICSPNCDYGWIENAKTGEKLWLLEWENTLAAGGDKTNRKFSGELVLAPGIYRAVYRSYGYHMVSNWHSNPPYNPTNWGMTLYGVDRTSAVELDPWADSRPFVRLTEIGNNEHEMVEFRVSDTTSVLISALGEITARGERYDYAWLEENTSGESLWKMSREKSLHAGGDQTNRVETALVDLGPGAYTIHFRTDGGHAFNRWSLSKPSNPDRWGVAMFAIDQDEGDVNIDIIYSTREPDAVDVSETEQLGEVLAMLEQVGNDEDLYDSFNLEEESHVYIVAQGEISSSGRWDYGWIEDVASGEKVWEMTLRNTKPAGGEDRNRRFEGKILLPAGSYTARYVSDPSHAYGSFNDDAPDRPADWGIRIFRLPAN